MSSRADRRLAFLLAVALLGVACGAAPPRPASGGVTWLEVEVKGLEVETGRVALALFGSAESYAYGTEPLRRAFLPRSEGPCVWRLEDLAPGDYAIKAFHDLDGSGRLETNFLGVPTEPYGFSNGARGSFGPPSWRQARFRLNVGGTRIVVTVG